MDDLNDDQRHLVGLVECPVAWEETCTDEDFSTLLRYMWFKVVQEHELDKESHLLSNEDWRPDKFFIQSIYSDASIIWPVEQVASWKPDAERAYRAKYKGFINLMPATPVKNPKHFVAESSSDDEVAEQSIATGNSKLYPRFNHQMQIRLLWACLSKEWLSSTEDVHNDLDVLENTSEVVERFSQVFYRNVRRFSVMTDDPSGCVAGTPSVYLTLEVEFSTPLAHMYPISEAEAKIGGAASIVYVSRQDLIG